jgi:hypothetical protein
MAIARQLQFYSMIQDLIYKPYFDEYLKSAFKLEVDLRFWKHFLSISIKNYKQENPENRWINEAGFSLYNLQPDGENTWLHVSTETSSIEIKDLDTHSDNFFNWIMNLSIIRIYNSAELLLLQAIQLKYFPNLNPIENNKKNVNKIISEIKNKMVLEGKSFDTTNNRYLIEFLKTKSLNFENFSKVKVNVDWSTTWNGFYEFFSILRNVITHHAMIITPDTRNTINSVAKDAFNYYFIQPLNTTEIDILKPKNEQNFLFFISNVNDFVANTVKFIAEETDFKFIGLHKA